VILLDTSVLSIVLRRRKRGEAEETVAARLASLLKSEEQVAVPGIVLQELLSGIAERKQGERVLDAVRESFPVMRATEGDHLKAADLSNLAARRGVAVSTPDALIAAQAFNRRASLFTTDGDFPPLAALAGLKLY
jgi:predicted nucleic acid-binding protein